MRRGARPSGIREKLTPEGEEEEEEEEEEEGWMGGEGGREGREVGNNLFFFLFFMSH